MDLSCPPSLFLQIFAAFLLTNIQKWLIEIVNIDLDEKVSLKDGFYMLLQKNTKIFAHPVKRFRSFFVQISFTRAHFKGLIKYVPLVKLPYYQHRHNYKISMGL